MAAVNRACSGGTMSSLRLLIGSFLNYPRISVTLAAIACAFALPLSALDPNKTISQFTHTSWSAKDGIPGPVNAIAQTPDGYLWLGTPAGLYRFDGLHFIPWEAPSSGDKLPRSTVASLFTARDGSLWIGFGSIFVGCWRNGVFRTYTADDRLLSDVRFFAEDRNGSIWAGSESGLSRFENGSWKRVGGQLGYPAPGAQALFVDSRGTLWVATDKMNFGLSKDNISVNTVLKLALNGKQFEPTGQAVAQVDQLVESPDGEIWIVEFFPQHTLRALLGRSWPNVARALSAKPLGVVFDGPSSLWIATYHGGIRRAPDFKRLEQVSFDHFGSEDGLSSDNVRSQFQDREGTIWFGTSRGLDRFRENKATPFTTKEGLVQTAQLGLTSMHDGSVWIMNFATNLMQRILGGRIVSQKLPPYSRSDTTRVLNIYADRHDHVWLGGSFHLAEGTDGKFSYLQVPGVADQSGVEAITSDSSDSLWVVVWEGDHSRVKRLRNRTWTDFLNSSELPNYRCRVLFGDALGRVWLGFDGEVAVSENDSFHRYSASDGLPPGRVRSISSDRAGHIWVASEGGLSRFDGRQFVMLTKENGLPGPSASAILEDDDGFLWVAGALGIVRVSPQEVEKAIKLPTYRMQTLFLDTTDGLPGLPLPGFSTAAKAADGRLWFSTAEGIAVIDPHRLPMNAVPPPVVIQTVKADDRTFPISPPLHFRPKVRSVEIGFAALSLSVPERVLFRYKLEGYDTEWHGPAAARVATYTNLPPRQYTFRAIACNNDGVWNEHGAAVTFDIAPTFFQTNWFLLLCGMVASFLAWVVYRWRLQRVTARLDLLHAERLSERERIARELHDTLLQGFQGLVLHFQAVLDRIPDQDPAQQAMKKALGHADQILIEGRERVRDLRAEGAQANELSQELACYGEELAKGREIEFKVTLAGSPQSLQPVVKGEIYRIGREALTNAFRHSKASSIEVEITYDHASFCLRIRDNGSGIDQEILSGGRTNHWGLSGMRERAKNISAQLSIWSNSGAGTEIELKMPANAAYARSLKRSPWDWIRPGVSGVR